MKTRTLVKILSMTLAFAVCVGAFAHNAEYVIMPSAARSVAEIQKDQRELDKKKKENQQKINSAKKNIKDNEAYQELLNDQIETLNQNIELQIQILEGLNEDIEELDADIAQQQIDLDKGLSDFKTRLRAMYMAGDGETAEVLAGSTDFYDLLTRMEIVKRISKHDNEMVILLTDQLEQLNIDMEEVQGLRTDAEAVKTEMDADLVNLQETYDSTDAQIARKKAEVEDYQKNQKEIEAEEKKIEAELVEAIKAAQQNDAYVGGDLLWPLPGYYSLTSQYGNRTIFGSVSFHKGIDISGPNVYGKPIVAANSGKVIIAFNNDRAGYSYGKYVVIDHGGGKTTLYGHMSKLNVSAGQTVKQGDVIGYVGSTGQSTGAHLHFEVRVNGQHTNPMQYFSR